MAATHKRGRGQRGYLPGTQCILCVLGAWRDRHATIALRSPQLSRRSGRVVMKYSFREDRKAAIAADWVVESVAEAARRALRRHGETERCVSIVSWPDRIELALRTAAGTAYAMLPGGPAGTMCSESLWVANPELPLLCLPGPYQNVGAQEQRGLL